MFNTKKKWNSPFKGTALGEWGSVGSYLCDLDPLNTIAAATDFAIVRLLAVGPSDQPLVLWLLVLPTDRPTVGRSTDGPTPTDPDDLRQLYSRRASSVVRQFFHSIQFDQQSQIYLPIIWCATSGSFYFFAGPTRAQLHLFLKGASLRRI